MQIDVEIKRSVGVAIFWFTDVVICEVSCTAVHCTDIFTMKDVQLIRLDDARCGFVWQNFPICRVSPEMHGRLHVH